MSMAVSAGRLDGYEIGVFEDEEIELDTSALAVGAGGD